MASSKKGKTHYVSRHETGKVPLIDLTDPGAPESWVKRPETKFLVLSPKKSVPILDLTKSGTGEGLIELRERRVELIDLTASPPRRKSTKERPSAKKHGKARSRSTRPPRPFRGPPTPLTPPPSPRPFGAPSRLKKRLIPSSIAPVAPVGRTTPISPISPSVIRPTIKTPLSGFETATRGPEYTTTRSPEKPHGPPPVFEFKGPTTPKPFSFPGLSDKPAKDKTPGPGRPAGPLAVTARLPKAKQAVGPPPRNLSTIGLNEPKWKKLEESSRRTLPRVLFRGFSGRSGGGIDKRLNSEKGIIPHGFLRGKKPTTMYDTPNLKAMINGHLGGSRTIQSNFSSWAADFATAEGYAGSSHDSRIAIIDTSLLEQHVRIYHVPTLREAFGEPPSYAHEYLVYGPIQGTAFHCVPASSISYPGRSGLPTSDLKTRIATAKRVATLFRPSRDKRPDIVIAMTVVMACRASDRYVRGAVKNSDGLLQQLQEQLSEELKALQLPSADTDTGLVNPHTYTKSFPEVEKMVNLLLAMERIVRAKRTSRKRAHFS